MRNFTLFAAILVACGHIVGTQSIDKLVELSKKELNENLEKKINETDSKKKGEQAENALFEKILISRFINFDNALLGCDYKEHYCRYKPSSFSKGWSLYIGDHLSYFNETGEVRNEQLYDVSMLSQRFHGAKCLMFKLHSSSPHIIFSIIVEDDHNNRYLLGVPGGHKLLRKVSVGWGSKYSYKVKITLSNSDYHGVSTNGTAWMGKIFVKNGPCLASEKKHFSCSFTGHLCDWVNTVHTHNWYPVPFQMHSVHHGQAIWGAFGALEGKDKLWSPIVTPDHRRCFTFTYVKSNTAYLRVWIRYNLPNGSKKTVLIYQDVLKRKAKQTVNISLFTPYIFQIQFEGVSVNALHSTIILDTKIERRLCHGIGMLIDIQKELPKKISNLSSNRKNLISASRLIA